MFANLELERMTREELLMKAYFLKGTCYSELKQHEEAIKQYDLALSLSPIQPDIFIAKARSLLELTRSEEALKASTEATRLLNLSPDEISLDRTLDRLIERINSG